MNLSLLEKHGQAKPKSSNKDERKNKVEGRK
jgi:hypothetical protein